MSQLSKIYVVGASIVNPLGLEPGLMATAVNAGISAIDETAILNKRLKAIKMARVPESVLPPLNPKLAAAHLPARQERLLRMASPALLQLQPLIPKDTPIPLVVALPEIIPGISHSWRGNAIEQLSLQSDLKLDVQNSRVAEIGRAGGLHAIKHVFQLMEAGQDWVLLGGLDSYWDPELLARLDAEDRLLVEGALDGFQPGEGACFVLFASERLLANLPAPHIALYRPGNAQEPGHRYSDQPYRGDGLANAVRDAIAQAPATIDSVWTGMIYDSFCSKEFGVAITRNSAHFAPGFGQKHPVDCFGDLGSAIGPTLIALIFALASRDKKIGRHHLLCCSSDMAYRSAVRLDIE